MRAPILLSFLLMTGISTAAAQSASAEEREVLGAVQRLFDAMRSRDTTAMREVFGPGARLVGMRPQRDGSLRLQELTAEQFAAFVANDRRAEWIERVWEPEVRVSGTLATVWAPYDFHFGGQFSHCGVDAIQLLRLPEGWKIVSIADTFVREGCPPRPAPR